jgi:hypothetical protein
MIKIDPAYNTVTTSSTNPQIGKFLGQFSVPFGSQYQNIGNHSTTWS